MAEKREFKVGQRVLHSNGFIGRVEAIKGEWGGSLEMELRVLQAGTSLEKEGEKYSALSEYVKEILPEVEPEKEEKVFKCEIEGMKFEGTASQFDAVMKTLATYMKKF